MGSPKLLLFIFLITFTFAAYSYARDLSTHDDWLASESDGATFEEELPYNIEVDNEELLILGDKRHGKVPSPGQAPSPKRAKSPRFPHVGTPSPKRAPSPRRAHLPKAPHRGAPSPKMAPSPSPNFGLEELLEHDVVFPQLSTFDVNDNEDVNKSWNGDENQGSNDSSFSIRRRSGHGSTKKPHAPSPAPLNASTKKPHSPSHAPTKQPFAPSPTPFPRKSFSEK